LLLFERYFDNMATGVHSIKWPLALVGETRQLFEAVVKASVV